jgi:hypothetical protein
MKYVFGFLLILLIIAGCGESEKDTPVVDEKSKYEFDTSDIKTEPVSDPTESFLLRYMPDQGEKYQYRYTSIINSIQSIAFGDTVIKQGVEQKLIQLIEITLKDMDPDSVYEVECNITSVRLEADANGQKFVFESGSQLDSADELKYADYIALINNPFHIRINNQGELVEITRVDRIVNKFLDIRGYADSLTLGEKQSLRRDMTEGALRPIVYQLFRSLPNEPVAKDSSWQFAMPATQLMTYKMENKNLFRITNLEMLDDEKIAVIDATIDAKITGESTATERGVSYTFKRPQTQASGKIYFNLEKGMIQKSRMQTIVTVEYSMEGPTPQGIQKSTRTEFVDTTNLLELL